MAGQEFTIDVETLRRYDKPGPRYTSYPTAVEFHEGVGEGEYRTALAAVDAENPEAPLSLYVHLPFCIERCLFCACNVVISRRPDVAEQYLEYLKREIDLVAKCLPRRRKVVQFHWGGGTPTYFTPDQLEGLFNHIGRHFELTDDAEVAIEIDPCVTSTEHLDRLAALGFNRLSLGVQDFTAEVQAAIERNQTFEETRDLLNYARQVGFSEGVNFDLVYGLPGQRVETFSDSLERALELRPDRLAIYSFAYVPWLKAHQRKIDTAHLPTADVKLDLYLIALRMLQDAGYRAIGMDHFALPEDELSVASSEGRLARNFMGYTVKPATSAVAFGITGIGDLGSGYFQNHKRLSTYYQSIDAGRLPIERGRLLDDDDRLRRWVITQLMCNFRVDKAEVKKRFGVNFDTYFAEAFSKLDEVHRQGFVSNDETQVRVQGMGRLFVRNIAMAFDRYLEAAMKDRPVFSRTV
ncbi:MAG: oxygen-independent coproporphyrinogen III oxidase [Acidobacteria bacterium]|nr:oxygen-independent coproporphyrinogen III oxidase [Acidobacteriota bacterium]